MVHDVLADVLQWGRLRFHGLIDDKWVESILMQHIDTAKALT